MLWVLGGKAYSKSGILPPAVGGIPNLFLLSLPLDRLAGRRWVHHILTRRVDAVPRYATREGQLRLRAEDVGRGRFEIDNANVVVSVNIFLTRSENDVLLLLQQGDGLPVGCVLVLEGRVRRRGQTPIVIVKAVHYDGGDEQGNDAHGNDSCERDEREPESPPRGRLAGSGRNENDECRLFSPLNNRVHIDVNVHFASVTGGRDFSLGPDLLPIPEDRGPPDHS